MNILGNAEFFLKLAASARIHNREKNRVAAAREEGPAAERQAITDALSRWIDIVAPSLGLENYEFHGLENIPEGPCVFICNHQSYFDILAMIMALKGHQFSFIAKDDLEKVPLLSFWVTNSRGLFIRRGDARESLKTIQKGVEYLKEGFSLLIFPEGTRSKGPKMAEFKPGSFKLATKAKVPVVPVTIDGTYNSFEAYGGLKKHQPAVITIHPSIETADMSRTEQAELSDRVWNIIHDALPPAEAEADPGAEVPAAGITDAEASETGSTDAEAPEAGK